MNQTEYTASATLMPGASWSVAQRENSSRIGRMVAALLFVWFLAVPEVVIRDLFLGPSSQPVILYLAILTMTIVLLARLIGGTIQVPRVSFVAWTLFSVFLLLSFISNETTVWILLFQPTLILVLIIAFTNSGLTRYKHASFLISMAICVLPVVSFVAHFLTPFNVLVRGLFTDVGGDSQSLVFLSFSQSIYRLGGLVIPRLGSIFDEPGTFGFFASIFGSLLYAYGRRRLARFVFICGLVSFSSAYLLFVALTIPMWIFDDFKPVRAMLFVAALALAIVLIWSAIPDTLRFLGTRFLYAFADVNNRSAGWRDSIESIFRNPFFGSSLAGYRSRSIGAHGFLVFMAYIGTPATICLLALVFSGLFLQARSMGYSFTDWRRKWLIIAAITITVANRNNYFNISGFCLTLFAVVAATGGGDPKTTAPSTAPTA